MIIISKLKIKKLIIKNGYKTITNFCKKSNIPRSSFYKAMDSNISIETAYKIASALNIELEELFEEREKRK